ncbi:phosphoadenosine phosphosulfate reductase family protein [Candidatus Pacearchaeota archaeon]|jgi:predicted phosphoadenosine phosphosulfate sulfurtransferase|nr:phosphoadenosine phosphosulfate reductase family protein [Candidatus Pacearchaeota archaeon]
MKIYRTQNVYDAALERIRWLFDEFPNVVASVSGGKDSTVIFHLCLQVAREKGRLPLKVFWLDQEAEWQATVDQVSEWMHHPDVEPMWMQFPFKLFNATSANEHWLNCWDESRRDDWVHPQVDISYKENKYGTDRFHELFDAISVKEFPSQKTCYIAGVRCEESPTRYMALTYRLKYKQATWAKILSKKHQHFTFYPLYDWSYTDIWKAILDNKWSYNDIYNAQYRYGLPIKSMRVSNVHHETSIESLFYLQEVEPDTYERIVNRISGIDMAGKMGYKDYYVSNLPPMFKDWREYRDYLLANLIQKPEWRDGFSLWFNRFDDALGKDNIPVVLWHGMVNAILCNDWEGIKLGNRWRDPNVYDARKKRAQNA